MLHWSKFSLLETATMQAYTLVSVWHLQAPLEGVWECLSHPERWPIWWPYVEQVEILSSGDPITGTGSIHRHCWSTCLPYRLCFTLETLEVKAPRRVKARVYGDLVGIGRCRLRACGGLVVVRFDWHVHTTKAWMNALAPLARPVFHWNHHRVMAAGEIALRELLTSAGEAAPGFSAGGSSNSDFGTPSRQAR